MNARRVGTSIRLEADVVARLDVVAEVMSARAAGATVTRSEAARVALERGLVGLEADLKIPKTKPRKTDTNK